MGFVRNHGPPYASSEKLCCTIVTTFTMPMLHVSVDMQNRINNSGIPYDPAGNTTSDGTQTYTWNAENRLTAGGGVTYTYDGDGRRVKKSNGKLYWYGVSGEGLTETDLSGNNPTDYIFFSGQRIARRDVSSGNVYYFFQDHLESTRVITDQNGATVRESDYYAFGGERVVGSPSVDDPHKFAGMYQDAESGQYYTWGRTYSPNLGRFLSPDPVAGSTGAPQSLNRYAYALNNPTNFGDPLGLTSLCIITIECYYMIYPAPPRAFEKINLGCREIGRRCTQLPDKARLSKKDQRRYERLKGNALIDIWDPECLSFLLGAGVDVTMFESTLMGQKAYSGNRSTITQEAAQTFITVPQQTVAQGFQIRPGVSAAASLNGTDVYFRQGGFLSGLFGNRNIKEETIEHEGLHNFLKLGDEYLQLRLGLEPNLSDTTNISEALKEHKCTR
jgi:RHS repeat-associated protein